MPNKPRAAQKRHIQLGQRFAWNGRWDFGDEEPGCLDPDHSDWKVEVLSKNTLPDNAGQRVYYCRLYEGPIGVGQTFFINEENLGETV